MKSSKVKTIIIIVLAVILVAESGVMIFRKGGSKGGDIDVTLNISTEGTGREIGEAVSAVINDLVSGISGGVIPAGSISAAVKSVVYSDFVVNTVASIAMPLLYQTLVDLRMLDFATNMDLYATGPLFAEKIAGRDYTCVDKDGQRKPLVDVLNAVGKDWKYMDTKVSYTDENGKQTETTIWNSIRWGVSDEATFYAAMNDVGEALRGVLEVALQGRERVVNVNVPEVFLGTSSIPINMDAATVYNETGAGGWEKGIVPLFNALGLVEGEYPSVEEFNAYESAADVWKAIFGSVLKLVEKVEADPVNGLTSMLVGFADAVESGSFKAGFETMRLDAKFNKLAAVAMDFSDGLLFNLGDALLEIVEQLGIKVTGSFNDLLDSLPGALLKKSVDLPQMDVAALKACAAETTLPNGNKAFKADSGKVVAFLVEYVMDDQVVAAIINATSLAGTPEGQQIISSVSKSEEGLKELANVIVKLILSKLQPAA